jgi:hypothetical protein
MTPLSIQVPFPVFQDRDGHPLDNGYVWIGEPNLNPQTNPVVVYFDKDLTIPAPQPLRTINGYVSRAGTPAQIYVDGVNFSILVQDSKGSMVYNFPDATGISPNASGVVYDPAGTGAVATTVQAKLRQTVSVQDFGAVADWNGSTGTDNSGAFLAAIGYANTSRKRLVIPAGRYSVGVSGVTYTASISNLEMYFEAGVELVCTYSGASYPSVLNLNGVGQNVKLVGNGAKITYSNAPASRGINHALYLFGDNSTMIDVGVSGFVITNSPNMGLAAYAGPFGGTASGNKNITIENIRVVDSKGDGVHVENFDSGVFIDQIIVESPGDDSVCVSNFVGTSGAPVKSTATTDVFISRIEGVNTYSALVRLLGVNRANITALTGTLGNVFGATGASAVSCDSSGDADYAVANTNIVVDGVTVFGGAGVFYYAGGAELTGLKICNAIQKQGVNYGIRLLQSGSAVGTKINNVTINNVLIERATNSGVAGDFPLWAINVRSLKVDQFTALNCPSIVRIDGCDRVSLDELQVDSGGSSGTAFDLVDNTNLSLGRLVIDGSSAFTTGVTATDNTNVWHTALWDMTGATSKLSRSGNTGVRGYCQRVEGSVFLGSITAGSSAKQTFSENMFTGSSYQLQTTLLSDQGTRWGTTGTAADGFFVLYTDSMTNVRINYIAETNVGY